MFKTIRQSVTFKANPPEVYEMLMDSHNHAELGGKRPSVSYRDTLRAVTN
jgi:hypothetical protein